MALRDPGVLVEYDVVRWRRSAVVAVSVAIITAMAVFALQRGDRDDRHLVSLSGSAAPSAADAPAPTGALTVSYVPPGLALIENTTRTSSERLAPGPDGKPVAAGSGKVWSQTYGSGSPQTGVISITVSVNPSVVYDLAERKANRPGTTDTSLGGRPATLFSQWRDSPSGARVGNVVMEWTQGPHVLVIVASRGPVTESELRAVAEGVSFQ